MTKHLEELQAQEVIHWAERRRTQGWAPIDIEEMERVHLKPCYLGEGDLYSENRMAFHRLLHRRGGWKDKRVLDYACGLGSWAVYFALTGAREVVGFDFNEVGISLARECAVHHGLQERITFHVMDARDLKFPDNDFDLVIGTGVLHHTIKYPGIFEELHRVMTPGARAFFLENLADFPIWRLWWWLHGERREGDVPIFSDELRHKTRMFSRVEVIGDTFVHSAKTFLYRPGMGKLWRILLHATHKTDEILFRLVPALRQWGSFSYIVLTK